ncbi:MAG: DUF6787 family protein [Cellulophaga sp.]
MQKFKERWQITQNWQLLFPILGLTGLIYSGFKLSNFFTKEYSIVITLLLAAIFSYAFLKLCLLCFKKLENKWVVEFRWEMIRVFIVFAITGSSSVFVGRPIIKFLGITKENLNIVLYWVLFIIIGLIFYQILLVCYGWLFGQFNFFWKFEKKMLSRFGIKIK